MIKHNFSSPAGMNKQYILEANQVGVIPPSPRRFCFAHPTHHNGSLGNTKLQQYGLFKQFSPCSNNRYRLPWNLMSIILLSQECGRVQAAYACINILGISILSGISASFTLCNARLLCMIYKRKALFIFYLGPLLHGGQLCRLTHLPIHSCGFFHSKSKNTNKPKLNGLLCTIQLHQSIQI